MTTRKRAPKKKQVSRGTGPTADRPYIPGYGVPKDTKGLLAWSHVAERMDKALRYWVCTVSPDGHPHATPVDGLWVDDRLYFGGMTQTRRHRNLVANGSVCVHLESALDVVILQGEARQLSAPDSELAKSLVEASARKYGYAPKPEELGGGRVWVFHPKKVLAWKQFPRDATRWRFQG